MEEYFWFISCDSQSERLRKMTCFTEKKNGKPTPPFLSSFRQELFPLPQRESQIFPFFFPSEFLFIFPMPNTSMLFFTFKSTHPKLVTCSYVFKYLWDPWEITMYLSSGHSQVYLEYEF